MRQLTTYFILAYIISWTIWLPLYAHAFGIAGLPTLPFHHALGGLGPLIASFLTTWMFYGRQGVQRLLAASVQVRPLMYLLTALLSPFLLAYAAAGMTFFSNQSSSDLTGLFTSTEFPEFGFITFFVYNLIFFGFGEEVGWRGFALPHIQRKFNALTSSMLLTFFWACWHLPLFFYRPGFLSMELPAIFGWLFSLLTGSILLTWLFNSSRGSILICAVFHSTIDIAFTADVADKNIVNYMGFLITVWGIVTIVVFKPKNLATTERVQDV